MIKTDILQESFLQYLKTSELTNFCIFSTIEPADVESMHILPLFEFLFNVNYIQAPKKCVCSCVCCTLKVDDRYFFRQKKKKKKKKKKKSIFLSKLFQNDLKAIPKRSCFCYTGNFSLDVSRYGDRIFGPELWSFFLTFKPVGIECSFG